MKRTLVLLAAGSSALLLAGCGDFGVKPPKGAKSVMSYRVISKLECPAEKNDLKLVSAAADGKSCIYTGPDSEVTLKLVSLNGGSAKTALSPIETELKALMPTDESQAAGETEKASGEVAKIDLPGVHIRADDNGAKVRVAGVNIDASDDRSEVRINHNVEGSEDGGDGKIVNIQAGDGESRVEVKSDRERKSRRYSRSRGIRATYILINEKGATEYKLVGYEARGPRDGPLAVAVVKSKQGQDHENDMFDDAKALIRLNVGRGTDHIVID